MYIVLVRHGRPRSLGKRWISPRELGAWIDDYRGVDIVAENIPSGLQQHARTAAILISSTAHRCAQSARALAPQRIASSDALFREAELPHAKWSWPRLPRVCWLVGFRLAWIFGYAGGVESYAQAKHRSREAAERLMALARDSGSVMLVGHGVMNALIARELIALGASGPRRPRSTYWGTGLYVA